jgi:phage terminase small subunit
MSKKLTDKQSMFVAHASRGVPRTQAARLAGFSAPAVEAYRLMRLAHVVDALHERRDAALKGDLAHMAVDTMRDLMGTNTPAATRFNAARWVLEHAGHTIPGDADQGECRSLEEMDAEELAHAVASGMNALKELAGQLEGHHVIDGQARALRTVEPRAPHENAWEKDQDVDQADFLQ